MDAWMDEPGARVVGHRGLVRGRGSVTQASCSCGQPFTAQPSVQGACLTLVQHLQHVVRNGAAVVRA